MSPIRSYLRLRRRAVRNNQRGLTLLEIMIVIAILGILIAVVAPKVMDAFSESKAETTKIRVNRIVNEYYPRWLTQNADKTCPTTLLELGQAVDKTMKPTEVNDMWGKPMKFFCGDTLPQGAKGLAVMSLGEDGKEGTPDDIKSW